jgi:flagellar capping protein FliD
MERYKGFLIITRSGYSEIRAYDGHRMGGTGEYEKWCSVEIEHIRTAKNVSGFRGIDEAKKFINKVTTQKTKEKYNKLNKEIKSIEKDITKTEKQLEKMKETLRKTENKIDDKYYDYFMV